MTTSLKARVYAALKRDLTLDDVKVEYLLAEGKKLENWQAGGFLDLIETALLGQEDTKLTHSELRNLCDKFEQEYVKEPF